MEQMSKTPDTKLRAGAIIGIVTSSISAVWAVIAVILVFTSFNVLIKTTGLTKDLLDAYVITAKVTVVVLAIISLVVSGIIIWLCRNVLAGKAKNGLAAGITLLIISALGVVSFFGSISAINIITLLISLAGVAGGILLILGKYETSQEKETVTQTVVQAE